MLRSIANPRYIAWWFSSPVLAHMQMSNPYPFRSPLNPALSSDQKDYDMTSPLNSDGSNFPCKGYHEQAPLESMASYSAGEEYNITLSGTATHNGGSCQISLSYDSGVTFKVIKSIIGGCPTDALTYDFTIPSTAPSGPALLAWTWLNNEGNREFYMNCAPVNITTHSTYKRTAATGTVAFASFPNIEVANLRNINNCTSTEGIDQVYCDAGSEVQYGGNYNIPPPPDCSCNSLSGVEKLLQNSASMSYIPIATLTVGLVRNTANALSWLKAIATNTTGPADITDEEPCEDLPPVTITAQMSLPSVGMSKYPTTFTTAASSSIPFKPSLVSINSLSPSSPMATPQQTSVYPSDPSQYLPCHPGSFLCTSPTIWLTCTQNADSSWSWTSPRAAASGMMCLPYADPAGYRDDRYVAANLYGSCSPVGAMTCTNGGTGFMICDNDGWVNMGSVAAGTKCIDGNIVGAFH